MARDPYRRRSFSYFWDQFMVYVALVNVVLIVFDLSYTRLRGFYLRQLPIVVDFFDPYKGILPHPLVERYLAAVDAVEPRIAEGLGAGLEEDLARLRRLSRDLVAAEPFAETHHPEDAYALELRTLAFLKTTEAESAEQGLASLWQTDPRRLPERLVFFNAELRPLLEGSYVRLRSPTDGEPIDRVWLLDLPFLCFFAAEFLVGWAIAVRRRTWRRWYAYPVLHWYDAVGLIPYFRIFRLLRVVSIYARLHRSELSRVGQGLVSRAAHRLVLIIAEEVTTLVAVRLLQQVQEEILEGTHRDILIHSLTPRRNEIRDHIVEAIRDLVASEDVQARGREFLRSNLEAAFEHASAVQKLPFSKTLLRPLVLTVGDSLMEALFEAASANLETQEGRRSLERTGDALVDALFAHLDEQELIELVEDVVLDVLERTRDAVAVKKWQN